MEDHVEAVYLINQFIKDGDYDDFEWTDENDKNDDNLTFCELFFDIGPLKLGFRRIQ